MHPVRERMWAYPLERGHPYPQIPEENWLSLPRHTSIASSPLSAADGSQGTLPDPR